jgi:hypothetical protein
MKSFLFLMTPTPKPETSSESFKPLKKAGGEISSEFKKVESKLKKLPIDRRTIFFIGLAMVILAFLNVFGQWVNAILGVLVMYFSFTGKNPLDSEDGK